MKFKPVIKAQFKNRATSLNLLLSRLVFLFALVLLILFVWGGNQPEAAGLFDAPWDKLAHLSWFAVLAGMLHFGLDLRRRNRVALFCLGVAVWDEWRQLALPGRSADLNDLIFDCLGIVAGLIIAKRIKDMMLAWLR